MQNYSFGKLVGKKVWDLRLFAIETTAFLHELAITICELAWLCHAGAVMTYRRQ